MVWTILRADVSDGNSSGIGGGPQNSDASPHDAHPPQPKQLFSGRIVLLFGHQHSSRILDKADAYSLGDAYAVNKCTPYLQDSEIDKWCIISRQGLEHFIVFT